MTGTRLFSNEPMSVLWSTAWHHIEALLEHRDKESFGTKCLANPHIVDACFLSHGQIHLLRLEFGVNPLVSQVIDEAAKLCFRKNMIVVVELRTDVSN